MIPGFFCIGAFLVVRSECPDFRQLVFYLPFSIQLVVYEASTHLAAESVHYALSEQVLLPPKSR